jgi:hypothetical protein
MEVKEVKEVNEAKDRSVTIGPVKNYKDLFGFQTASGDCVGELAECKFWIELAVDEGFITKASSETILKEYGKLGFIIHKLWKEWRKL